MAKLRHPFVPEQANRQLRVESRTVCGELAEKRLRDRKLGPKLILIVECFLITAKSLVQADPGRRNPRRAERSCRRSKAGRHRRLPNRRGHSVPHRNARPRFGAPLSMPEKLRRTAGSTARLARDRFVEEKSGQADELQAHCGPTNIEPRPAGSIRPFPAVACKDARPRRNS